MAKIIFKRKMEYHLITTFLQTFILITVGCLTLFFKEDNFTDRVMVTVTTLLVVVTLMSSIQAVSECLIYVCSTISLMQQKDLFLKQKASLNTFFFRQNLPKAAYFKLIDWWMLFTLSIMALLIMIHTYLARATDTIVTPVSPQEHGQPWARKETGHNNSKYDKEAKKINRVGISIVVAIILIFNIGFWAVAIKEHSRVPEEYLM